MIEVKWTARAVSDLLRVHEFLEPLNPQAAAKTVQSLTNAALRLSAHPRIGRRLRQYDPREVRRLVIAHYEIRYELRRSTIYVLRVWHTRENR